MLKEIGETPNNLSLKESEASKAEETPIVLVATAVDPSANPDEVKPNEVKPTSQDIKIVPKNDTEAALAALVQSLVSSAEFRFVR